MQREYDFTGAKRGPLSANPTTKTRITIRLDSDLIDWFRERANDNEGSNYQTLINRALRTFVESESSPLEDTLRRIVREELRLHNQR